MVNIEPEDAVTNNDNAEMVQRTVQSQGRVDIPDNHLREVLNVGQGDTVHLIPGDDGSSVQIVATDDLFEWLESNGKRQAVESE